MYRYLWVLTNSEWCAWANWVQPVEEYTCYADGTTHTVYDKCNTVLDHQTGLYRMYCDLPVHPAISTREHHVN